MHPIVFLIAGVGSGDDKERGKEDDERQNCHNDHSTADLISPSGSSSRPKIFVQHSSRFTSLQDDRSQLLPAPSRHVPSRIVHNPRRSGYPAVISPTGRTRVDGRARTTCLRLARKLRA